MFKPSDKELIELATQFDEFLKRNGVPVQGVVTAQVIDFPLVGPEPYTYDPTMFLSYRDPSNRILSYDLQLMLVSGNAARDLIAAEVRQAFGVQTPAAPLLWQNFENPPAEAAAVEPISAVGEPISGQPGFYHPTHIVDWSMPAGVRYRDPAGRGWFVWVASIFDRKWQKLG